MSLTKEQLLMPRYKVIAPYLHMDGVCKVGDILQVDGGRIALTRTPYVDFSGIDTVCENFFPASELDKYPHLFKRLPWWARPIQELPEYIKNKDGIVIHVKWHRDGYVSNKMDKSIAHWHMSSYPKATPATLSEYEAFLNNPK